MADLDADLGHRLARLAESVPVAPWLGHVEPSPVAARQRVRMAWLTPLVALVAFVVGTAILGPDRPGATSSPSGGVASGQITLVHASTRSGDFLLEIQSRKAWYLRDEPIEISARLTYLGSDRMFDIRIGHGAGGPMKFGIVEPVNGLTLSPAWLLSCNTSALTAGRSLEKAFEKSGGFEGTDPRAAEWQAFYNEPRLILPTGTWHPYVQATFSLGDCDGSAVNIRAEIEIQVVEEPPPAPTEPGDGPAMIDEDGPFALELRADRQWYAPGDAIDVTASLLYSGSQSSVEFRHDDSGPIAFGIRERVFGGSVVGVSQLMWEHTTLERWVPLIKPFQKGGSTFGDDPEAELFMAWVQAPILQLPEGTWHLFATASGDEVSNGEPPFTLSAEIVIVVSDDPAATPGPATPEPFRNLPVYGGDDIGSFTLQLKSERARYEAAEPIELSTWYTASDSGEPTVIVSHLQPEAAFAIEQLDAVDPETKTWEPGTTCSGLGLIPMAERNVRLTPDNLMLLKADPLPPRFLEELEAGVLRLPVGVWRITVDIRGAFGRCEDAGDAYALHTSVEIEVVEQLD